MGASVQVNSARGLECQVVGPNGLRGRQEGDTGVDNEGLVGVFGILKGACMLENITRYLSIEEYLVLWAFRGHIFKTKVGFLLAGIYATARSLTRTAWEKEPAQCSVDLGWSRSPPSAMFSPAAVSPRT